MTKGKRDLLRNLVALIVLGGLAVYASLHRKKAAETSEAKESAKALIALDMSTVQKIEVINQPGRVVLERRPKDGKGKYSDQWAPLSDEFDSISEWVVTQPYHSLPQFHTVDTFLKNLKDAKWEKLIQEQADRAADYGLGQSAGRVAFHATKESEKAVLELEIGDQNPSSSGVYLTTSASPKIYLGDNSLNPLRTRPLGDWRKKEIVGFKSIPKINSMKLTFNGGKAARVIEASKEKGQWKLLRPKSIAGDRNAIEEFFSDLKSIRADEFETDSAEALTKKAGFDRPWAQFEYSFTAENGEKSRKILFGSTVKEGENLYLRRMDFPTVFRVRHTLKATLNKQWTDFVQKRPFTTEKMAITGITAQWGDKILVLAKKGAIWSLETPKRDSVDAGKISGLLSTLHDLKAQEYIDGAFPSSVGKASILSLELSDGKRSDTLALYPSSKDEVFAATGGEPAMHYRFDKEAIDGVLAQLDQMLVEPEANKKPETQDLVIPDTQGTKG